MKRVVITFCIAAFLLTGCQFLGDRIKEPVTFYYVRRDYREDLSSVIDAEEREASGHRRDLPYLMALYMMGPIHEQLATPLPAGTRISVEISSEKVILTLSGVPETLTDGEFSVACACLAYTCMDITGTAEVTINNGSRTITITNTNLSLTDSIIQPATEEPK